ncbi:MAG TPA: hypothetical protein VEL74_20015 [Thermoanaerobaculia bacterium]|nr:hypothetical protein [Thermoanaerobaculia bacterium]
MDNSIVYRVLTSFAGCIHRGEDREAAHRAYGEAVQQVQRAGDGSVTLMSGSAVVERFQLAQKRRTTWLTRLLGRRRRAEEQEAACPR